MKINFLLFFTLFFCFSAFSQDFTGQWKGQFTDRSTAFSSFGGDQCDYTLDIECHGNNVEGYSYTYFSDAGKTYYTICKLTGFINKKQKYIEIKEVERTKTNVPVNIRNCFQIHKLTYFKKGDTATLEGKWIPAPQQQGDCGFGTTMLARRELRNSYPNFNAAASKSYNNKKKYPASNKLIAAVKPPIKKTSPVESTHSKITEKSFPKTEKEIPLSIDTLAELPMTIVPEPIAIPPIKFEKRSNTVLKTIQVSEKTVRVDLYDNGEVDGDSISLFYNGQLLLSRKRLSEKPITLTLTVEDEIVNELVMYAENLGTIPPNTALMVVTDGHKRYEVRITSDLQKSGVINFVHKPN